MGIDPVSMFLMSAGLQVASGISQYTQQKKADKAAASAAVAQGNIMNADASVAANQELSDAERFRRSQRMMFLKSGVTLDDSPLLVMQETRDKGAKNAQNIIDSAKAKSDLVVKEGSVQRASLTNTALDTATTLAGSFTQMQALKAATQRGPQLK